MTDRQAGQLLQPSRACALRVNKQTKQQQQPTLSVEKITNELSVGLGPAKAHMIQEKEDENEKEMREDREREKDA